MFDSSNAIVSKVWSFCNACGAALETHYNQLLRELAKAPGILGQILLKAQNKIQNPAMLFKIINMTDSEK